MRSPCTLVSNVRVYMHAPFKCVPVVASGQCVCLFFNLPLFMAAKKIALQK